MLKVANEKGETVVRVDDESETTVLDPETGAMITLAQWRAKARRKERTTDADRDPAPVR